MLTKEQADQLTEEIVQNLIPYFKPDVEPLKVWRDVRADLQTWLGV